MSSFCAKNLIKRGHLIWSLADSHVLERAGDGIKYANSYLKEAEESKISGNIEK